MRSLIKILGGSHLYGLASSSSDQDFYGVHIPSREDLLLQKAADSVSENTNLAAKNSPDDTDMTSFALHHFLQLVMIGNMQALDLLFATRTDNVVQKISIWDTVWEARESYLTRNVVNTLKYCHAQVIRHGSTGERLKATQLALQIFERSRLKDDDDRLRVRDIVEDIAPHVREPYLAFRQKELAHGNTDSYLAIGGKMLPFNLNLNTALDQIRRWEDEFGNRARSTAADGADFKAMSHAIRIGYQCREYLETGSIQFPLKEREFILGVKTGKVSYEIATREIDCLVEVVENAAARSQLPSVADNERVRSLIMSVYDEHSLYEEVPSAQIFGFRS